MARKPWNCCGARQFDLVLLDIMMPNMNGYEVLEQMKADDKLRHIPVIMISAVDEIDSVVRCIELGAEDYLSKPFNPTLLRARVGASLERKRLHDQVTAQAADLAAWNRTLEAARRAAARRNRAGEPSQAVSFAAGGRAHCLVRRRSRAGEPSPRYHRPVLRLARLHGVRRDHRARRGDVGAARLSRRARAAHPQA